MKTTEILGKITKLPVPQMKQGDAQVILRLVTVLATTHLVTKINKTIKKINELDNPDQIIGFFK